MPEITSFFWFHENRLTAPIPYKSTSDPKTVCYNPWKRPEMPQITSFYDIEKIGWRGPGPYDSMSDPKPCAIGHENGKKCPKSRILYDFMKIVCGSGPFKSTSDPKIVCYSPLKRPEIPEITSFLWFRENRVTGPEPYKSMSDPKTMCYSPWKRPEMHEITSFYDFEKIVWRVPDNINPRRTPKPCAIAHKMARNARNHELFLISWKSSDSAHTI